MKKIGNKFGVLISITLYIMRMEEMRMEEGLFGVLEERHRNKKSKEKRDEFFKHVRGERKLSPLIKRIRGETKPNPLLKRIRGERE